MIESIIFLALFTLVPLLMLTFGIIMIVRWIRRIATLRSLGSKDGFQWIDRDDEGLVPVQRLLESSVFTQRSGKHRLSEIIKGSSEGLTMWYARYHWSSAHSTGQHRRGSDRAMLVISRTTPGPRGIIFHQSGASKLLLQLFSLGSTPDDERWSWASVSGDIDLHTKLPENSGEALKELTLPGDILYCAEDHIVLSRNHPQWHSLATSLKETSTELINILELK